MKQPRATACKNSTRIVIRSGKSMFFLKHSEIQWVEANGSHTRFHMDQQVTEVRVPFERVCDVLDPRVFRRIHRSAIVNVNEIRWLMPALSSKSYRVVLRDGTPLNVSRREGLKGILSR